MSQNFSISRNHPYTTGGRLAIDAEAVRRAARMDGTYVLLTNDDTLSPKDVG